MQPKLYSKVSLNDLHAAGVPAEGIAYLTTLLNLDESTPDKKVRMLWSPSVQLKMAKDGPTLMSWMLHHRWLPLWRLANMDLKKVDLEGAMLKRIDLSGANLFGANLKGAMLQEATLMGAFLYEADLTGANLLGANLAGMQLDKTIFDGANLLGAYYPKGPIPTGWIRVYGHLQKEGVRNAPNRRV